MNRLSILIFSILSYGLFGLSVVIAIIFLNNLDPQLGINLGADEGLLSNILINAGLITLFGFSHSLLAREPIKKRMRRFFPAPAMRSVYVFQSSVLLIVICLGWQAMPNNIVVAESELAELFMYGLQACGWILVLASTFSIDHGELVGLKQAFAHWKGQAFVAPAFKTPFLYRWVRHPMQLGLLIAFWATPDLTQGHALFAGLMTLYIVIGLYFEERSLVRNFGKDYQSYQSKVPMLLPLKGYCHISETDKSLPQNKSVA